MRRAGQFGRAGGVSHVLSILASNSKDEYEIGQTLEIRFDPDNPQMVSPNTFWSLYGFAALSLPISLLLTLAIFIRIRAPG